MGAFQRFLVAIGLGRTDNPPLLSKAKDPQPTVEVVSDTKADIATLKVPGTLIPFDPHLSDRAHTQYQFGDWESLAQINTETLGHQSDRAKLAILAATGRLQTGREAEARKYLRLAQDWGANKTLISRVLIASVYNSLGRAAALSDQSSRALQNFSKSIVIGTPSHDARLLIRARTREQLKQIGLRGAGGYTEIVDFDWPLTGGGNQCAPSRYSQDQAQRKYANFSSREYWEERYLKGGTSGYGSYGRLAEFKAKVINKFMEDEVVERVIEFGCGDGNQLSMLRVKSYVGVDISTTIIDKCKDRFKDDPAKLFFTNESYLENPLKATLTLSLDVIFHLIEDDIFENYMDMLFDAAERYCIIYACDEDWLESDATHVRRRRFTKWIADNLQEWRLMQVTFNRFPDEGSVDPKNTSFSNFYFYTKI